MKRKLILSALSIPKFTLDNEIIINDESSFKKRINVQIIHFVITRGQISKERVKNIGKKWNRGKKLSSQF